MRLVRQLTLASGGMRRGVMRFLRRICLYTCGVISLTFGRPLPVADLSFHQLGEPEQVAHSQERAPPAHDNLQIWHGGVGPLPRNRKNLVFGDMQQQRRTVAVVALAYADELPSRQWVEGMRYADKTRCRVRRACILH